MSAWDPNIYLRFSNERTRPAIDLVSRIDIPGPERIIDLGCGPGNSTEILHQRWPHAHVTGLDNSAEMLSAAQKSNPALEWILADASAWQAATPYHIIFSNAALQWMPDHARLIPRLFAMVAKGGALAFQIPARLGSPLHQFILQVAEEPEWAAQMAGARTGFLTEGSAFYYDALASAASAIDLWETEYYHIMQDHQAIITWAKGAALRPFLDALGTEEQRERFTRLIAARIERAYRRQGDGKVLFPFRRLFVVAYRR